MTTKSYLVRLEADQSTIVLPGGKYSGNSRISLSEDQIDKISDYQYSILQINYYNDKASTHPEEVIKFDQGELRHEDGDDEVPQPDSKGYVDLNGYKVKREELDKLQNRIKEIEKEKVDTDNEISDNEEEDICYCNFELNDGGYCEREVESEEKNCWQHS